MADAENNEIGDGVWAWHKRTDGICKISQHELPSSHSKVEVFAMLCQMCLASIDDRTLPEAKHWLETRKRAEETSQCLAALHYHKTNTLKLEAEVDAFLGEFRTRNPHLHDSSNSMFWWGLTNKFTFEYHAFAVAVHRCLFQLAITCGRMYRLRTNDLIAVRGLFEKKVVAGDERARKVIDAIDGHRTALEGIYSRPRQKSYRDWIVHEGFLEIGALEIHEYKLYFRGVLSEDFKSVDESHKTSYRISRVINSQYNKILSVVIDLYNALVPDYVPSRGFWENAEQRSKSQ